MNSFKKIFFILLVMFSNSFDCSEGLHEKKIVVIIPSYNNQKLCKANLDSVFKQIYKNYVVIYIDDASTDKTRMIVEQYIKNKTLNKMTLIKNQFNRKAVANIYKAVHTCNDDDLIIILDGDDQLAHNNVFKIINKLFSTHDIWLSYANYINVPPNYSHLIGVYAKQTPLNEIKNQTYRTATWKWSGLRIFYAWLFKKIKLQDLICNEISYEGKFFPAMWDGAFLFPMMEMSGFKTKYIKDILLHRTITLINDSLIHKPLQKSIAKQLSNSPKYKLLYKKNIKGFKKGVDLIAYCFNLKNIESFIKSVFINLLEIKNVTIFYKESIKLDNSHLVNKYKNIIFIKESKNIGKQIFNILKSSQNSYVLFCVTNELFNKPIDLNLCTEIMYRTFADCFYLNLSTESFHKAQYIEKMPCENIEKNIYAWKYKCNELKKIHDINFTLNNKNTIFKKIDLVHLKSINELYNQYSTRQIDLDEVGIFFHN